MSSFSAVCLKSGMKEKRKKRRGGGLLNKQTKGISEKPQEHEAPLLCLISKWHKPQLVKKFLREAHKTRSSGQNDFQTASKSKDDEGVLAS